MRVYASTATLLASVASAALLGAIVGATMGLRYSSRRSHRHRKRTMPKRLILVRHGESQGNIDPSLYTRVPDNALHLTELGYEQAVAAGRSIKQILGDETVVCVGCMSMMRVCLRNTNAFVTTGVALYRVPVHAHDRDVSGHHQGLGKHSERDPVV